MSFFEQCGETCGNVSFQVKITQISFIKQLLCDIANRLGFLPNIETFFDRSHEIPDTFFHLDKWVSFHNDVGIMRFVKVSRLFSNKSVFDGDCTEG